MTLIRNITGTQTFLDQPIQADVHKVRVGYFQELRDKTQDIVDDLDEHIGNYGVDHHRVVDYDKAGFMSVHDKIIHDEHVREHTGPIGGAHGVASASRHGFQSATDKYLWDNHRGYGGVSEHPLVTPNLAGFMSPDQAWKLQHIWDTYVTKEYFNANMFRIYYITRTSPSLGLGADGGTGWFYFSIDRGPLEAAAGRQLMPFTPIFKPTYTIHSYLYNWGSPFPIIGADAQNIGSSLYMGVLLSEAGTYHRGGALQYTMSVPLIPTNSVVSI